ncbi:hypothetical protein QR680_007006 [Steinernema hermaphroditum]|uniref:Uncharacterized protein n=1 Tax=Steinernema hermaphroditum TaxID=289476 RepID=A0AA39HZT3_9BILA|nr:hypothetical protein QR680_007006 [Steinernema hermaphroditum]
MDALLLDFYDEVIQRISKSDIEHDQPPVALNFILVSVGSAHMATKPLLLSGLLLCVFFLSVASDDYDLCIHSWVKKPPENKNQSKFLTEDFLKNFYSTSSKMWDRTDMFSGVDATKIWTHYKSTKPYCLYLKPVNEALKDAMYSNDIFHSALLNSTIFDILSFDKSVVEVCSKPGAEEAGIGHVKLLNKASRGIRRAKWVKVRWYCCRPAHCGKTIDEIETRMLTMLLPVNYQPKRSHFYGNHSAGAHLKKRSISPCFDIYGERYEFATPHYDTPVCPVYAFYDAKSPSYEFNHGMSRKRSALNEMWKTCLLDANSTVNTCFWDYKNLLAPVELKCCCRRDLKGCTYKLSNRRQYTRCFQFFGRIREGGILDDSYPRGDSYRAASADACFMQLRFDSNWPTTGIAFTTRAATPKRDHECLRKLHERNVSVHCEVKLHGGRVQCPFDAKPELTEGFTRSCCCRGTDLCNLSYAREMVIEMIQSVVRTIMSHQINTGKQIEGHEVALKECPANPNEYLYTEKKCVQYHLPNYERLNLIENHNFHIKDYVEFGKFSKCSLLEIQLTKNAFTGKTSNGRKCADLAGNKKLPIMLNTTLFVLRCECSGGEICNFNKNSPEVMAIDTRSPCNTGTTGESSMLYTKVQKNSEPSSCWAFVGDFDKNGQIAKTLASANQSTIISTHDFPTGVPQVCQMVPTNYGHAVHCACPSKDHKPCNDVSLLNKAVNLYYGRSRIEVSSDDEAFECQLDEKREVCYKPGCFLTVERNETRLGCIHRSANLETQDRYERRLCLSTGMQNDCKIVVPTEMSDKELHILCCCNGGPDCKSEEFTEKRRITLLDLIDLMKR